MSDENPFNLVYTAMWDMIASNENLTNLVREGNRIRFDVTQNSNPLKKNVADGDLIEVILAPVGFGDIMMQRTSNSTSIVKRFAWLISTGDMRVHKRLHVVEWAIIVGMLGWKERLAALQWKDKNFVKRADIIEGSEGESDPDRNRGIKGWSAVMTTEIEMHFATGDIRNGST